MEVSISPLDVHGSIWEKVMTRAWSLRANFGRVRLVGALFGAAAMGAGVMTAECQTVAEKGEAGVPARFHGVGCNIKYAYMKPPVAKAEECVANKTDRHKHEAHEQESRVDPVGQRDDFIRIKGDQVSGPEWVCKVREIKGVTQDRMNFSGDCSNEGSPFAATVTLILRPGKVVTVDTFFDGHHVNNDYRVRERME
jgi:hypothetical protein